MNPANLNQEITILIQLVEQQAENCSTDQQDFFNALLNLAKTTQAEVTLTKAELNSGEEVEERIRLGEELAAFASGVQIFYMSYHDTLKRPTWLRSGRKKEDDFYAGLLTSLHAEEPAFVEALEKDKQVSLDAYETKLGRWQELKGQEEERKEVNQKIHQAYDLRALLIGALRFCGLTEQEIRKKL